MEWRPYVPVAVRRARARREMAKLRKQGRDIQPITIEGRTIARNFWGKRWCEHLESFSDYANRLPRGRTYVRNGSVCHLAIRPGRIDAIVSGSELYNVTIRIGKLKPAAWTSVKTRCAGQIGSMLELLQGRLSQQVMGVVTDRSRGLFPEPGEIKFDCTCPDWAAMCKHVAAVLYGVGSRLDNDPEALFLLRGVDTGELIATEMALPGDAATDDALADDALAGIFGIELDPGTDGGGEPRERAAALRHGAGEVAEADAADPVRPETPGCRRNQEVRAACPQGGPAGRLIPRHPSHRKVGGPAAAAARPLRRPICRTARCIGDDGVPLGSRVRTAPSAGAPTESPDGVVPAVRQASEIVVPSLGPVRQGPNSHWRNRRGAPAGRSVRRQGLRPLRRLPRDCSGSVAVAPWSWRRPGSWQVGCLIGVAMDEWVRRPVADASPGACGIRGREPTSCDATSDV